MMMRACAKCGQIVPATERYCAEHKREDSRRRNAKATKFGYQSAHWKRVRAQRSKGGRGFDGKPTEMSSQKPSPRETSERPPLIA